MDTVTVVDEDGDRVTVTSAGDGKYTFTQPKGEVTITVTFVWDKPVQRCAYGRLVIRTPLSMWKSTA